MSQFTKRIVADADDGCYLNGDGGGWSYSNRPMFGYWNPEVGIYATAGIRFTNVTVPSGATITSAYLSFVCRYDQVDVTRSKIGGIDEDNTASMSSDPTGRTQTTAKVDWDITSQNALSTYTSPDIKTIVQEIIDRGGWSSGNAMGFLILNDGSDLWGIGSPYSYEGDATKAFLLTINYVSPSASPSKSPSKSPSVSPSMSPSPGVSYSPSLSPSKSPSQSPSVSVSPSISKSPSKSPSVSPSISISPSYSPGPGGDYGLKIKKPSVNKNVNVIDDPKELVFTSAMGVLGLRLLDTVTASTDANGDINITDNHNIGYPPITFVTFITYSTGSPNSILVGKKVSLPIEWPSDYLTAIRETVEVTEIGSFSITATSINITLHAEAYNHDTFEGWNISGRSYTFNIYYYFNELVET
jgi:hypothetical protein